MSIKQAITPFLMDVVKKHEKEKKKQKIKVLFPGINKLTRYPSGQVIMS